MTELDKYIKNYFGISEEEVQKINHSFKPMTIKKGDFYLKTGRISDRMAFLKSGIMREFLDTGDSEITKWVSTEGNFLLDVSSFFFNQPARWNVQALTDCELYVIDKKGYNGLTQAIPRWHELERLFLVKCFMILEERIVTHISMTAEERYIQLFDFNPELFNRVPLQYLASMLGIAPETLSRLRKKPIA